MANSKNNELKEDEDEVFEIIDKWVEEIVSELSDAKISSSRVTSAIKESEGKIIEQLTALGLNDKEARLRVSQVKGTVISELKKDKKKKKLEREKEKRFRGMMGDKKFMEKREEEIKLIEDIEEEEKLPEFKKIKKGYEEDVFEIMDKWISEIVSELSDAKISSSRVTSAIKESEREIIEQLTALGLNDKEARLQVSQVKGTVISELKKDKKKKKLEREKRMRLRGMRGAGKFGRKKEKEIRLIEDMEKKKKEKLPGFGKLKIEPEDDRASEIINKWVSEIASGLEDSKISSSAITRAIKKSEKEITGQLNAVGLTDREVQFRVSQMKGGVINELKRGKKERKLEKERISRLRGTMGGGKVKEEKGKEVKLEGDTGKGKKEKLAGSITDLKFTQQMILKIEDAMCEIYGEKICLNSKLKFSTTGERQLITAEHNGKTYEVILKEVVPKNFYDPTVLKFIKYIGGGRYKIKHFKVQGPQNLPKHYTVTEKIPGRGMIYLKMNPKYIRGIERRYLERLGKIIALTYVCAIPERTSDNIIWSKIGNEIKLTTFNFANSFDYKKYPPVKAASSALDMNVSFLKDTAAINMDALRNGFIEAFNCGKKNQSEILKYVKPLKSSSVIEIKKILKQNPEKVFDEIIKRSKFFSKKY